jgi:hypothetical protein
MTMDKTIEKTEEYIKKAGELGLDAVDLDELFKVVDIYKDLKEVENMNNYGEYGNYNGRGPSRGAYGEYNEYGRRGVDSPYRASKYMDSMRGSYEAYEDYRGEYNRGNYGAKEDGLKELDYMMHAAMKFIKMIKEEATSPEEQEIVRKHIEMIKNV